MASKDLQGVHEWSPEELAAKEHELTESLFHLRLRHGTNQLENAALLGRTRRNIARLKTIQRARELGRKG